MFFVLGPGLPGFLLKIYNFFAAVFCACHKNFIRKKTPKRNVRNRLQLFRAFADPNLCQPQIPKNHKPKLHPVLPRHSWRPLASDLQHPRKKLFRSPKIHSLLLAMGLEPQILPRHQLPNRRRSQQEAIQALHPQQSLHNNARRLLPNLPPLPTLRNPQLRSHQASIPCRSIEF